MLIVQRFGVRIFGAFLPLPPFFFAIAATAQLWGAASMAAQSLRRRTRAAQITRTELGLLGDGTHAQAMAPALGVRAGDRPRAVTDSSSQVLGSGREKTPGRVAY